ncbi:MAG: hypothetical protein SGILL_003676 [Bacillariaceae sp.]
MTADIGLVISSLFFGYLSDKVGRKPCVLACQFGGALGSILKYLARGNYWTFCGANFFTGLFAGSLAVGMAYASDAIPSREGTDSEMAKIIAISLIGRVGGGILAILLQSMGLFIPLLYSAGISLMAGIICFFWMVEARDNAASSKEESQLNMSVATEDSKDESMEKDEVLDKRALWNVLAGELADNLGSIGLVPICISPLMFQTFYQNFVDQGLDPIMSAVAYKWLYVCVALIVVPGAAIAPFLFKKYGPALSAVTANIFTGIVTVVLLQVANISPVTFATYAIFVAILYAAFPLTVISQLSTGPMLDRISPLSKRGQIQGLNLAFMNLASAIGPFLYGILADATSIDVVLYTTTGVSLLAAVVNAPLTRDARFGPESKDNHMDETIEIDPSV